MKKVVVIGGGFAGTKIAKRLENSFEVTLIDTKDYFEFTPGILRTVVEPFHIKKIQILHKSYLKNSNIIRGSVKNISKNKIYVNNKIVKFDYLAICSGSNYKNHFKDSNIILADRIKNFQRYHNLLIKSKNILIIGGGLVGVELAGEISTKYPKKEITIIHSKNKLIERNPKSASDYAEKFLKKRGVEILYNNYILKKEKNKLFTKKGDILNVDLVFLCTGINPNSKFLNQNLLNKQKQIIVNENLQVKGYKNIFAAGDINDILIEKTAQNAEKQANMVIKNIKALESSKKLLIYNHKKTPLVISLGKYSGIFIWNNFVFTGFIPGLLKNLIEFFEIFKIKYLR